MGDDSNLRACRLINWHSSGIYLELRMVICMVILKLLTHMSMSAGPCMEWGCVYLL